MLGISPTEFVAGLVEVWAMMIVVAWDLVAAEPKLQVILAVSLVLMVIGGRSGARRRKSYSW